MLSEKTLSERDICTKYITPTIEKAGWKDKFLEEVSFTDGRIYVRVPDYLPALEEWL